VGECNIVKAEIARVREKPKKRIIEQMFNRNPYKRRNYRNLILIIIAVVCLIAGVILLLIDPIKNMKRQAKTDDMLESIVEGSQAVFVVKANEDEVNGEEYEDYNFGDGELDSAGAEYQEMVEELPDEVILKALGRINIPSVDIDLPLWSEATKVSLRYGAGRLEKTADPGEEGNMVILGHRMRAAGKIFNRLGDVKIGDDIIISTTDGYTYTYRVDKIYEAVKPEDLDYYVDIDDGEGTQVTLVTCTPLGVATHRLLVIGHLI